MKKFLTLLPLLLLITGCSGAPSAVSVAVTISNVASGGLTPYSATVTWDTDIAAGSQVEYGTTATYGSTTALDSSVITAHSVAVGGLEAETEYHYRVLSGGAVSANNTFTTLKEANHPLPNGIVLKDIPAGTFIMGGTTVQNDAPVISVTLSAFSISEKEITNREYIDFLNAVYADDWITVSAQQIKDPCGTYTENMVIGAGSAPHAGEVYLQLGETGGCTSGGEAEHTNNKSWIVFNTSSETFELLDDTKATWPVNWVKWHGAHAFAQYYSASLPTEAQWEYAARGGQQLEYPTDDGTLDSTRANYNGDTPGAYNPNGHSVATGSYPANPYGLYDMGGNVWEWCQDYYDESFYTDGAVDPVNTSAGPNNKRIRRGGSWNYHSSTLRTYSRASDFENRGNNHFGFRIAKQAVTGQLTVYFIDVGQGDAVLIDYGEYEMLIDGGRYGDCKNYFDANPDIIDGSLEVLVETHPDADHIGGLYDMLADYSVTDIWLSGDDAPTATYDSFVDAVDAEGATIRYAKRDDEIALGDLTFDVLNPTLPLGDDSNENSIVLLLSFGQIDLLFTGDIGSDTEASMVAAGLIPDIEILKVGHHGSKYSSTTTFLNAASPETAVYSASGNQYGHPTPEALTRLDDAGAIIYGTDIHGTIKVTINGATYEIDTSIEADPVTP